MTTNAPRFALVTALLLSTSTATAFAQATGADTHDTDASATSDASDERPEPDEHAAPDSGRAARADAAIALTFTGPGVLLAGGIVAIVGAGVASPPCFQWTSTASLSRCATQGDDDAGLALGIVGGVVAGVGVVMIVSAVVLGDTGTTRASGSRTELYVAPGPGDVGLSIAGTF